MALMLNGCTNKASGPSPGTGTAATPASKPAADSASQPAATPAPPKTAPAVEMTPDDCGLYTIKRRLPPRFPCKADGDCGWTGKRPGVCYKPLCPGHFRAGTHAWVEAANRLHKDVCTGHEHKACIRVRCVYKKPRKAVCRDGKCELVF